IPGKSTSEERRMKIMKRFFYVMSLNWILVFVDKHITSGWSRKKKNPTNKKQKAKIHTLSPFPRKP
ncbi:hypothetical protein ACSLN1_25915, partial [Escherichia coli]